MTLRGPRQPCGNMSRRRSRCWRTEQAEVDEAAHKVAEQNGTRHSLPRFARLLRQMARRVENQNKVLRHEEAVAHGEGVGAGAGADPRLGKDAVGLGVEGKKVGVGRKHEAARLPQRPHLAVQRVDAPRRRHSGDANHDQASAEDKPPKACSAASTQERACIGGREACALACAILLSTGDGKVADKAPTNIARTAIPNCAGWLAAGEVPALPSSACADGTVE